MLNPDIMDQDSGSQKRRITLNVSTTSVLTLVVLVLGAITAAYIWGVMAGRATDSRSDPPQAGKQVSEQNESGPGTILQAHELEFTRALRGEKPLRRKPEPAPGPEPAPASAPEPESGQEPSPQLAAEQPVSAQPQEENHPSQDTGGISDYIFQVAALRDEQACDSLRQKLEGLGFRTRMERSGKVYVVLIAMRGTEARVAELNQMAAELRLGAPLLRSKKPVVP